MESPSTLLADRHVCLVTNGHIASNPRAVKEADALVEAGARVTVVAAQTLDWLKTADADLAAKRRWTYFPVDVTARARRGSYAINAAARRIASLLPAACWRLPGVAEAAFSRTTRPLRLAALGVEAELYIAHNLAALPAAAGVAAARGAKLGFDAEDLHSEELMDTPSNRKQRLLARTIEDRYMPRCDQLTASAPMISAHYAARYRHEVTTILNVFPLGAAAAASTPRVGPPSLYWFSQTIGPGRGLEPVIDAMPAMKCRAALHLRGAWAPGYEAVLRRRARDAGVADRLHAHPRGDPEDMVRLASVHDIGLSIELTERRGAEVQLTARAACLPNKLFTYLLAGLPVLLSDTPAQAELHAGLGEAAALIPLERRDRIAETVDQWLLDEAALRKRKRKALELAASRFNWDLEKKIFLGRVARTLASRAQPSGAPA
jgi:glycosyltransferase involved in cell wall biosynthesis